MEQTISPRQLRRWFGRVALTLLVTFVVLVFVFARPIELALRQGGAAMLEDKSR